jgi:hypothetical protein
LSARIALSTLSALNAGGTHIALRTLKTLRTLNTRNALRTLSTHVPLRTLRTLGTRVALSALKTLWTLNTRYALRTLSTRIALGPLGSHVALGALSALMALGSLGAMRVRPPALVVPTPRPLPALWAVVRCPSLVVLRIVRSTIVIADRRPGQRPPTVLAERAGRTDVHALGGRFRFHRLCCGGRGPTRHPDCQQDRTQP